jgi:hypothetical protein
MVLNGLWHCSGFWYDYLLAWRQQELLFQVSQILCFDFGLARYCSELVMPEWKREVLDFIFLLLLHLNIENSKLCHLPWTCACLDLLSKSNNTNVHYGSGLVNQLILLCFTRIGLSPMMLRCKDGAVGAEAKATRATGCCPDGACEDCRRVGLRKCYNGAAAFIDGWQI